MGHKVHPNGFRLGVTAQWTSNWYAERGAYRENLNKDIAVRLKLSANTVAVHRANIMATLGVHKTAELVVYALQHGLVNPLS